MLQIQVKIQGTSQRILAVCDGGAELAVMSRKLYSQLDPKPELRPTEESVRGLYGPEHTPLGECTVQIEIPELSVQVHYDVVVDDIEEDLLIDAAFMHYTGIQINYVTKELTRKERTVKGIARVNKINYRVRRVTLQKDWVVQPQSRQLVAGRACGSVKDGPEHWILEPSRLITQQKAVLVAKSLCQQKQVGGVIPVEIYNPSEEPVHLYKCTTLGLLSPVEKVTEVQLDVLKGPSKTVNQAKSGNSSKIELPEELRLLVSEAKQVIGSQDVNKFEDLIREYRDVFSTKDEPLGQTDIVKHEIKTSGEPIKMRYRRVPTGLKEEAIQEEERMKKLGVIEPSESPWAAPVVLVRKKDGTLRYCIDYRRLNQVTQKDSYPLPNIQDCLDSLDGAKFFSSIDLCSGYWQVQLSEDAKDKSSFYGAGGGLWRFKVMPFGLCNAPATFERLMERVLGQLQWQICLCYLDDILIHSRTVAKHLEDLRTIFDRLRQAKLKLKPKKCHFFQRQVKFLGHVVSQDGISTDEEKVQKISDCPAPQDVHEVRSVLGMFSYYRRFIPHFSEIAKPLIKLTEKDRAFTWSEEQEQAFSTLKTSLIESPVLSHPKSEGQFVLDTDASNEGIGAVLSQIQDGEERVIAFGSKTLSKTEKNYCITRKELWAVVYFVTQYKHFLLGRKFLVRTDNSAVRYWTRIHSDSYDPQGQTARWMVKLAAFDFDIKHHPGKQHNNADGMSRAPFLRCAQCEIRHEGAYEKKRSKSEAVLKDVSTQTVLKRQRKANKKNQGKQTEDAEVLPPFLHSGGKVDGCVRMEQGELLGSKGKPGRQTSKAGAITRGRMPHGPKACQGTTPSWMEGGVCLTQQTLMDEQLKDPACVDAMCWLQQGKRPEREVILSSGIDSKFLWGNFDCLVLENGLLCKKVGPLTDGSSHVTVIVPPSLRREMIKQCHDTKTAGHFYYWKTVNKVKKYFTWGGLNKDVQVYCQACHVCATRKTAGRHQKAEMRRYDVGFPLEEIAIDLMGPFPESETGSKYVLVVVDSFSKWMEAYAVPNIEAKTIAEKLVLEFISRFGVPYQIKSDRGRQFDCELFREMCSMLDVDHKMSTSFHPQGNSRVERMVKVVGNLIGAYCQVYKEWDKNLPLLTLAYRTTVHEVTGFSPNYVMMGREVSLPLDIMIGVLSPEQRRTAPVYVEQLQERLRACFEEVRLHLKKFGEKQKRYYNLKVHGEQHKVGDLVYLREKTRKKQVSPKLMPKWKGPYMVVQRFGTVYEVMLSPKVTRLYHFDLLKPCHSQEIPPWIKRARNKLSTASA